MDRRSFVSNENSRRRKIVYLVRRSKGEPVTCRRFHSPTPSNRIRNRACCRWSRHSAEQNSSPEPSPLHESEGFFPFLNHTESLILSLPSDSSIIELMLTPGSLTWVLPTELIVETLRECTIGYRDICTRSAEHGGMRYPPHLFCSTSCGLRYASSQRRISPEPFGPSPWPLQYIKGYNL
ncbi:hypothetical protein DL93DRAFT_1229754 [Clavulina sp. PMI_390]|nr:hypothetical protein DL93DRAFT_1229754 [Clavulina sp. PMI_390]